MLVTLSDDDYRQIAGKVLKIITEKYELVPKQEDDEWVGLKEFRKSLPIIKGPEWIRTYILLRPEFKNWAINIHAGPGHRTKVNKTKGKAWVEAHVDEINWKQPLP